MNDKTLVRPAKICPPDYRYIGDAESWRFYRESEIYDIEDVRYGEPWAPEVDSEELHLMEKDFAEKFAKWIAEASMIPARA